MNKEQIIEAIKAMTVLELNELVKACEEEFGVSAAAPVAVAGAAAAGGGAVTVTVSGKKEVVSVKISPEAVDPDDVEMLEDMIVAAANEAFHQMEEASSAVMAELTGGLGGLGGLSF